MATPRPVHEGRHQSMGQVARLVILHLIDSPVDESPLRAAAVLGVQQHMIARPAVARQQPISLQQTEHCTVQSQHFTACAATPGLKMVDHA